MSKGPRRGPGPAAAALRAPVADLLLALYRRIPRTAEGDHALLDTWLSQAAFA